MSRFSWQGASSLLFLMVFGLICLTFKDYGVTWDEYFNAYQGNSILFWYGTFFQNELALNLDYLMIYYGGFYEAIAQFFSNSLLWLASIDLYDTRHFVNALFGLLGVYAAYKTGTLLAGPMGGFFSALFLILTPRYYGHLFNNPKDIPFAALFLLSLYFILSLYQYFPRPPKQLILKTGFAIGATLGMRIGGILLAGYLGMIALGWLGAQYLLTPWAGATHSGAFQAIRQGKVRKALALYYFTLRIFFKARRSDILELVKRCCLIGICAWAVMLIAWPWAQVSPLFHPLEALRTISKFPFNWTVFFEGKNTIGPELPWYYGLKLLALTTPEYYFIAMGVGLIAIVATFRGFHNDPLIYQRFVQLSVLCIAAAFPIVAIIVMHSVIYDGIRHLLFVLAMIAVLCGTAFASFLQTTLRKGWKALAGGGVAVCMGVTIFDMIELHPYQSIYFNRWLGGGVQQAALRYETDYWGNSFKASSEWAFQRYAAKTERPIKYFSCEHPGAEYYLNKSKYLWEALSTFQKGLGLPEDTTHPLYRAYRQSPAKFVLVSEKEAELVIAYTRWDCHKQDHAKTAFTVFHKNTPLNYVLEIKRPPSLSSD